MSTSLEQLQKALRELKLKNGEPTYEALARATHLSTTTIGDVFTGKRPAGWRSTSAVVKALDGDLEVFQILWDQARHGADRKEEAQPTASKPPADAEAATEPRGWLKQRRNQVILAAGGLVIVGLGVWFVVPQSSDPAASGCWRKYKVVKDGTVRSQDNQVILGEVRRGDEVRVDTLPEGAKNRRYEATVLRNQVKGWVVTANLDFEATVCDAS
jgi:hypothetical protein